jgi:hypothetical protein
MLEHEIFPIKKCGLTQVESDGTPYPLSAVNLLDQLSLLMTSYTQKSLHFHLNRTKRFLVILYTRDQELEKNLNFVKICMC